jgi:hypothetical protein
LGKIGDAEEQVAGLQQMLVEKKFLGLSSGGIGVGAVLA